LAGLVQQVKMTIERRAKEAQVEALKAELEEAKEQEKVCPALHPDGR
jgi:hypothetical protein